MEGVGWYWKGDTIPDPFRVCVWGGGGNEIDVHITPIFIVLLLNSHMYFVKAVCCVDD